MTVAEADQRAKLGRRSSAIYLLAALLQGLSILIVQPITVRIVREPAEWGLIVICTAIVQVGVVIAAAGIPAAITRTWFDVNHGGHIEAKNIATGVSFFGVSLGLTSALVYFGVQAMLSNEASIAIGLALAAAGFQVTTMSAQAIYRARGAAGSYLSVTLCSNLLAHVLGAAGVAIFTPTADVYLTGYSLAVLVTSLGSLSSFAQRQLINAIRSLKAAARFGLPLLPHSFGLIVLSQAPVILLAATLGPEQAGSYGKVQVFAIAAITIIAGLNNAWVPFIMGAASESERTRNLQVATTQSISAAVILSIGAASVSVVAVPLIADSSNELVVARILPLIAFGYSLYLNASTILFICDKTKIIGTITPLVSVLFVGITVVAGNRFSLEIFALVVVGSYFLLGLSFYLSAKSRQKDGWRMVALTFSFLFALSTIVLITILPPLYGSIIGIIICVIITFPVVFPGYIKRIKLRYLR